MVLNFELLSTMSGFDEDGIKRVVTSESSICRCLFGFASSADTASVSREFTNQFLQRDSDKWNFDFRLRRPLPDSNRYEWARVNDTRNTMRCPLSRLDNSNSLPSPIDIHSDFVRREATVVVLSKCQNENAKSVRKTPSSSCKPSGCNKTAPLRHSTVGDRRINAEFFTCEKRKRKSPSILGSY